MAETVKQVARDNSWTDWQELPLGLKVEDVMRVLRVSRATAFNLVNSPGFPAVRVHKKRIVVPRDKFRAWLEQKADAPLDSYK